MKSTLCLLGLATLALTSCVQNEVLEMPEGKPIEFSSFVEKGTRAVTPINSRAALKKFWVFGENGDANFALDVTGGNLISWSDPKNQYTSETHAMWEVGKTYYFAAYSDGNYSKANVEYTVSGSNQLTIPNYSVDDEKDLIAAIYPPKTISKSSDIPSGRVVMPFQHMLTRVSFEFENSLPTSSTIGLRVKSLSFSGAKTGATCVYSLAADGTYTCTWTGGTSGEYIYAEAIDALDILGPSQSHTFDKFVIPQGNNITATLVVETYHQKADKSGWEDTVADEQTYSLNLSFDHPNKTETKYWYPGYVYNYLVKASSDVAYIHFDASVADWERDLDANGDNGTNDDIGITVN